MDWPYPDYGGSGYEADEDPGPSVQQIAKAVADGLICSACSEGFVKKHGFKVACDFCFRRMSAAEIEAEGVRLATHAEGTAEAFRRRNRKKKAQRRSA